MPKSVMIVSGESSGELYGALLAGALKSLWPDVRITGVGGERMKKAGVEVFAGIGGAFGLVEVVSSLKSLRETFNKTVETFKEERPDVLILIDYPDFNFKVAEEARKEGIKVLYYVTPQVWAWRKGRVRKIGRLAQRVAVILPFEEAIYRDAGIWCEFVGHPILDEIYTVPKGKDEAKALLGLEADRPYMALLPGSRTVELERLLPLMLDVVRGAKKEFPDYGFVMPLAPNLDLGKFRPRIERLRKEGVESVKGGSLLALSASDAAVIASGTAVLQAAFLERPMVVVYKVSPVSYQLARLILDVKYITLVNILLDRPVIAELIQNDAASDKVLAELRRLTGDSAYRQRLLGELRFVRSMFSGKRPSLRVAEIAGEMAGWEARPVFRSAAAGDGGLGSGAER